MPATGDPTSPIADPPSILEPRSPAAQYIAGLGWLMFAIAALVVVFVVVVLLVALFRPRRDATSRGSRFFGSGLILGGGIVFPVVVLALLFVLTLGAMGALAVTDPGREAPLTIEVIGHQYWWEVRYPDQRFETANEIHIPSDRPVEIRVTSADVIHSFWVPQLHGKIDLLPGQTNAIIIPEAEPGIYYGECAEFCGVQHAKMAFVVVVEAPERFAAWVAGQQRPAIDPVDPLIQEGQQIFLGSSCVYCHTIKGTNASGELGPDLTHLASRRTLAAGTLKNNRGNLAGWITNPQTIKPGNLMPPTDLTGEQLQALLVYLESLD